VTDTSTVRLERKGRVLEVTIDRPPLNVLDIATMNALREGIEAEQGGAEVILLRSAGEKVFSAGVEVGEHTPDKVPEMLGAFHGLIRFLLEVEPVTVAEVQGAALGGAAEVLLCCDLVVAANTARIAFPEIQLACYPPVALAWLPMRVGPQRAAEMVLTGEAVGAERAQAMGLVNRTTIKEELRSETEKLVEGLLRMSPQVVRLTVKMLRHTFAADCIRLLDEVEKVYLDELSKTDDMQEGIQAFLEKRKPAWKSPE
jgi:cyclohexa-1,5-dienecarbonyl-CoA hydratase